MKKYFLLLLVLSFFKLNAQQIKGKSTQQRFTATEKYFSFNPLALAELQVAIGAGFGNRFSERSEYFTELSYIAKHPFYDMPEKSLHGFRFLAQYRYHFLQRWRPLINLGNFTKASRERNARHNPFIGVEFRLKPFNFTDKRTFFKSSPPDTLNSFLYKANAVSIGGAILFGETYNISSNGKWKLEVTAGIGGKVKIIKYKNLPVGYTPLFIRGGFGLKPPAIDDAVGMPYFPFSIRLKYMID
ncbi:hypothetical protein [Ferruginibacter sp.]